MRVDVPFYLVLRGGGGRFFISFSILYFCITKNTSARMQIMASTKLRLSKAYMPPITATKMPML